MTNEKKNKKVFVVEWSAPCLPDDKARIHSRKIFEKDKDAEAFIQELTKAAALIGIEAVCKINMSETELN